MDGYKKSYENYSAHELGSLGDDEIPEVSILSAPPGTGGGGTPKQWIGLQPTARGLNLSAAGNLATAQARAQALSPASGRPTTAPRDRSPSPPISKPKAPVRRVTLNTTPAVVAPSPPRSTSPSGSATDSSSNHSVAKTKRSTTSRGKRTRNSQNANLTIRIESAHMQGHAKSSRAKQEQRKSTLVDSETQTNPFYYPQTVQPGGSPYTPRPNVPAAQHNMTIRPMLLPPAHPYGAVHPFNIPQMMPNHPNLMPPGALVPTTMRNAQDFGSFVNSQQQPTLIYPSVMPNQLVMNHPMHLKPGFPPPQYFQQYPQTVIGGGLPPPGPPIQAHYYHPDQLRYALPPPQPPYSAPYTSGQERAPDDNFRLQASETSLRMVNQPWSAAVQNPRASFHVPQTAFDYKDDPGVFPELNNEK